MTFIKKDNLQVGSTGILNRDVEIPAGTFIKGTKVTITGISPRGYDIKDDYGNIALEIGLSSVEPYSISIEEACNKVLEKIKNMSDEDLNKDYEKFIEEKRLNGTDYYNIIPSITEASLSEQLVDREIFDDTGKNSSFYIDTVIYVDNKYALVDAKDEDGEYEVFAINIQTKSCSCLNNVSDGFFYLK